VRLCVESVLARLAVVAAVAAVALVGLAQPGWAHIGVSGQPARAGAQNAVVTFVAEAESRTAGITGLRVQLPTGIAAADVSLLRAPAGWRLTVQAGGYTVAGPALPAGRDAGYAIRVARLPVAESLVFKTIQSYSDGRQDAWIELPAAGGGEPEMPAPVLRLAPAAAPATTTAAAASTPSATAAAAEDSGGSGTGGAAALLWIGIGIAAAAVLAGAAGVIARRRAGGSTTPDRSQP